MCGAWNRFPRTDFLKQNAQNRMPRMGCPTEVQCLWRMQQNANYSVSCTLRLNMLTAIIWPWLYDLLIASCPASHPPCARPGLATHSAWSATCMHYTNLVCRCVDHWLTPPIKTVQYIEWNSAGSLLLHRF
jgi:hypothetical protein